MAAVDSEESTVVYREGERERSRRNICKVAKVGPFFAVVAGVAHGSGVVSEPFDALRETQRVWRSGDSLDTLAARLGDAIPGRLLPLLEAVRRAEPDEFVRNYQGQAALQLLLLGTEQGSPQVRIVEFIAAGRADSVALSVRRSGCPGDCVQPHNAWFLGTHDRIDQFVRTHAGAIGRTDERTLDRLIALEYEDKPEIVGGPVSIVRADRTGTLLLRNGVCSAEP